VKAGSATADHALAVPVARRAGLEKPVVVRRAHRESNSSRSRRRRRLKSSPSGSTTGTRDRSPRRAVPPLDRWVCRCKREPTVKHRVALRTPRCSRADGRFRRSSDDGPPPEPSHRSMSILIVVLLIASPDHEAGTSDLGARDVGETRPLPSSGAVTIVDHCLPSQCSSPGARCPCSRPRSNSSSRGKPTLTSAAPVRPVNGLALGGRPSTSTGAPRRGGARGVSGRESRRDQAGS